MLAAGQQIGRYEIRSCIGAGGMGEVYRADDPELERSVAIKILPAALASDQQRLNRFIQEARAASALNHPNILTVHEIGACETAPFIVMEYIDGENLRQHMNRVRMNLREVLEIATQLASALSAAHEAGIVHRDVKPENVMIRHDRYVKLLDFGLVKLNRPASVSTDPEAPTRALIVNTDAGVIMGSSLYMSPEQAGGHFVDARTDIWSLGVIIYEMVAGRPPFRGGTPTEIIAQILEREPVPLAQFAENVPAELQRIVDKALTKERDERYQDAKDLLIDLKRLRTLVELGGELEGSSMAGPDSRNTHFSSEPRYKLHQTELRSGLISKEFQHLPTSSAEYIALRIANNKFAALAGLGILIAAIATLAYIYYGYYTPEAEKPIDSIAVLPFVNASTEADTDYVADGISEALINSLARLDRLRVAARSSAFRYRGRDVDPVKVGRDLKVRAVLTGRVRQVGNVLNVQVDLVDTSTGAQIWGEEYQWASSDILSLKQDIAREISEKLSLRLSGEEQSRLEKTDTLNSESYRLYLKGRYYWNKREHESLRKAIDYFNQAIEKDPGFAVAYAGLADSYVMLSTFNYGNSLATEVYPQARAAVDRALAIDESLAEAHTSLAFIKSHYEWDWAGAEIEFQRAIALDAKYPTAHHWYSRHLIAMERFDEASAEIRKASELDPLSLIIVSTQGDPFFYQRQFDEAIVHHKRALELDPNFRRAHTFLKFSYEGKRMYEDAIGEREKLGEPPEEIAALRKSLAARGEKGYWRNLLETALKKSDKERWRVSDVIECYGRLGDKDHAFELLDRVLNERYEGLAYLNVDPRYDSLRSDPRFRDLLRRVGLTAK